MPMSTQDKLEIHELLTRAYLCLDTHNDAGWASCFAEDGVFVAPYGEYNGRAAVQQFIKGHIEKGKENGVRHFLTNLLAEGNADDARVLFYIIKMNVRTAPDINATASGDCLVARTKEGWLFKRFRLSIDEGSVAKATQGYGKEGGA